MFQYFKLILYSFRVFIILDREKQSQKDLYEFIDIITNENI